MVGGLGAVYRVYVLRGEEEFLLHGVWLRMAAVQQPLPIPVAISSHLSVAVWLQVDRVSIAILQLVGMAALAGKLMQVFKKPVADSPVASPSPASVATSPASVATSQISMGSCTPVPAPGSCSGSSESEDDNKDGEKKKDEDDNKDEPQIVGDLAGAIQQKQAKINMLMQNRAKVNKQLQRHKRDLKTLQTAQSISLRLKRRRLMSKTTVCFEDSSDEEPVLKRPARRNS